LSWRGWLLVALTVSLAWGLRGQHGAERGAALVGALAALSLSVVCGGGRWVGAAVLGSLTFAIGGALPWEAFLPAAQAGSLWAFGLLVLAGWAWGGLGALGMSMGLTLSRYRGWERIGIAGFLAAVWFVVDQLMWGQVTGADDLQTRGGMIGILAGAWVLLTLYAGLLRKDRTALRMGFLGGAGFAAGFALMAWFPSNGGWSFLPASWNRAGSLIVGFLGGMTMGRVALAAAPAFRLPAVTPPWERWLAFVWLVWLLPVWLLANNLDYWVSEKVAMPVATEQLIWNFLWGVLLLLFVWGVWEIREGRHFATAWMPRHLRKLFLFLLWVATAVGTAKTFWVGEQGRLELLLIGLAVGVTGLLYWGRRREPSLPSAV